MNKLKVAFFIDEIRPGAGTENQMIEIIRRLDRTRFECSLFTLRKPVDDELTGYLGVPVHCLHLPRLKSLRAFRAMLRLARRLRRERIDIAMLYFPDSQLFVPPAAQLSGRTVTVVNRRDMGYWYTPQLLKMLRRVNRWVDYFLTNAQAVKQRVIEAEHFPEARIKVIHNMAKSDHEAGLAGTRAEFGLPETGRLVGIVANLRPVKRVDRFLEVASRVAEGRDDIRFVVLGDGELRTDLVARAREMGIAEKVVWAGSVSNVASYISHFDIGLLTSESEGLSNTLIEYSSAGVPSVAFRTGGNPEVIAEGETGFLVEEGDIETMAARVGELLDDPERRQLMGEAAKLRATQVFSPEARMAELEDFLLMIARPGQGVVK